MSNYLFQVYQRGLEKAANEQGLSIQQYQAQLGEPKLVLKEPIDADKIGVSADAPKPQTL